MKLIGDGAVIEKKINMIYIGKSENSFGHGLKLRKIPGISQTSPNVRLNNWPITFCPSLKSISMIIMNALHSMIAMIAKEI